MERVTDHTDHSIFQPVSNWEGFIERIKARVILGHCAGLITMANHGCTPSCLGLMPPSPLRMFFVSRLRRSRCMGVHSVRTCCKALATWKTAVDPRIDLDGSGVADGRFVIWKHCENQWVRKQSIICVDTVYCNHRCNHFVIYINT